MIFIFLLSNSLSFPSKIVVSNFINMRFSMTVTLAFENTSDREQGTISNWPFSQVRTRLTLQNSEYLAIFDEISNSTKSPLAK